MLSTKTSYHVRWMVKRDMPQLLFIENEAFGCRSWSEEDFFKALRDRQTIGMVCEFGEQVVGYMVYKLYKFRLELLRFAVSAHMRRNGVATAMMAKLMGKLAGHRRTRISCDVSEL